jgi:hypothetical protein
MADASGAPAGRVHAQGVIDHQELLAVCARDDLAAKGRCRHSAAHCVLCGETQINRLGAELDFDTKTLIAYSDRT